MSQLQSLVAKYKSLLIRRDQIKGLIENPSLNVPYRNMNAKQQQRWDALNQEDCQVAHEIDSLYSTIAEEAIRSV